MWPWKKNTPKQDDGSFSMSVLNVGGVKLFIPSNWTDRTPPPGQLLSRHGPEGTISVTAWTSESTIDENLMKAEAERIGQTVGPVDAQAIISFDGRKSIRLIVGNPPVFLHYLIPSDEGPTLMVTYAFFKSKVRDRIGNAIMTMENGVSAS